MSFELCYNVDEILYAYCAYSVTLQLLSLKGAFILFTTLKHLTEDI